MKRKTLLIVFTAATIVVWSQTEVTFTLTGANQSDFKYVGIRGSVAPLSWEETYSLQKQGVTYTGYVQFPDSITSLEFKYVLFNTRKDVKWEALDNREIFFKNTSNIVLNHTWDTYEKVDIRKLERIPSEKLLKDFTLLKTTILDVHPGTYRYASKEAIAAALKNLELAFQNDLSFGQAYLAISAVLGTLQCDHTFASFYNQGRILKAVLHEQKDKVPFSFSWVGGRMVVLNNASEVALPKGTEILKINGVLPSLILETLMPYAKADGATDKSRIKQLEVTGYPYRYNAFDVFYPLVYPNAKEYLLEIRTPNGMEKNVQVPPITREERAQKFAERYPEFPFTKEKLWGYQKLEERVGLLKAGTFDDSGMDRDWAKFFKATFAAIKKDEIDHLIVDLRENQGGFDEIGEGLMRYLIKHPGSLENYRDKTRFRIFPEVLKPYVQSWGEPWYYTMEVLGAPDDMGYYERPEYVEPIVKPAKNAFEGKVYFLIGPGNVSMAYYLATAIKKNGVGVLIGAETGGNQRGINGGQLLFLRLPNTKIEIDVPVVGSFALDASAPNQGVVPDIVVETTIEDIIARRDPQLNKALALCRQKSH